MAKARTLVGLDVHATKIVAAVLDAETGRAAVVSGRRRCRARRPGCAPGCRGRCAPPMRPGRPATGSRASSRAAAWSAWSRRRARSRARRVIASRPTAATPSSWCGLLLAGKLHAVRVPGRRGGGAARPGPRARGGPRGSDALPAPALQAAAAPRHPLRRRARVDRAPPRLAGRRRARPRRPRRRRCATRCGAVDALVHRRDALEREIVALLPDSPWQAAGRAAALPARDRHADRRRAVRRDRRLRTLRARRAADELRRAGPVREHAPASSAGSARSPRPAPATPAGCWSRPPGTTASAPPSARRSPSAKTASPPHAVAIAWSAQQRLHRTWKRLEQRAKRRTIIAVAAARELAGFCWAITPASNSDHTTDIPSAGSVAARHTRGEPATQL